MLTILFTIDQKRIMFLDFMGNKPNILTTMTSIGIGDRPQNIHIKRCVERLHVSFNTVIGRRVIRKRIHITIHIQFVGWLPIINSDKS